VNDLHDTMRHRGADGLAAPQAGIPLRLAIVEGEHGDPLTLVNPQITVERGPVSEGPEGCLSVLGVSSFVERHQALQVTYEDPLGGPHTL